MRILSYCAIIVAFISLIFISNINAVQSSANKNCASTKIISGMGLKNISAALKEQNIISSRVYFEIFSFVTGKSRLFRPGNYYFCSDQSYISLVKSLTEGPSDISATIAPGLTLKEIDRKLSDFGVISRNELINFDYKALIIEYPWLKNVETLEGFLLPDTYFFASQSDVKLVVKKFLNNFEDKALPFFKNTDNIIKILTLASILEKEIPNHNEQRIAANIFEKRLSEGMPLQVDASIIYAKCMGRFLNCSPLKRSDFSIDSLYNSYKNKGLPPTPISNPSVSTIEAALHPIKSEYWFYLSDPKTKKTIFSRNFDEHNQNRNKYLLN